MGSITQETIRTDRPAIHENTTLDIWIKWLIITSCVVFILVLILSAVFDPAIRVLHAFQALIYVAVIGLAARRSAWGYGAGCFIAAFWNWVNLFHTTFIANGMKELLQVLRTGEIQHPDQLIAVIAATSHFVLIAFCLIGFSRIKLKSLTVAMKFFGGGLLAIGYFLAIILLFGRQFLPLFGRVFHISIDY